MATRTAQNHGGTGRDRAREELDEDIDRDEIAALVAIANLDEEAAVAYDLVALSVDDRELREMLRSFSADHRRHVRNLDRALEKLGQARHASVRAEDGLLPGLATTMASLHPIAAVNALIANEHLTNGAYENALIFVSLLEVQDLLSDQAADERRHLEALLAYQEKHIDEDVESDIDEAH